MSVSSNIPLLRAEGSISPVPLADSTSLEEEGIEMATPAALDGDVKPEEVQDQASERSPEKKQGHSHSLQSQLSTISAAANVKG